MPILSRRHLLAGLATTALPLDIARAVAAPIAAAPAQPASAADFSFLFLTDAHIQPELNATAGVAQCLRAARRHTADFAIQGGDHVFDALGVAKPRATLLADLYHRTEQDLGLQVHHTIGNHDCFGIYTRSGVAPTDPLYGKKFFEDNWGSLYRSFDHKGVHFVILDSIGITADRQYEGRIDAPQIAWLAQDLASRPLATPVLVISHIPLVTAFASYVPPAATSLPQQKDRVVNTHDILKLFKGRNILGVLQGHTHINEAVTWNGLRFITSGAVCGNWWHGTRLGAAEGYTLATIAGGKLTTTYQTYGFHSVDPHDT